MTFVITLMHVSQSSSVNVVFFEQILLSTQPKRTTKGINQSSDNMNIKGGLKQVLPGAITACTNTNI
jgi:hypothetical protein